MGMMNGCHVARKNAKGGYWGQAAEDNVGPDHAHGVKGRPTDWSGFNPYIFCPEASFGPEKIIPPRVPTQNLVRIFNRTSPPIAGGPGPSRATASLIPS